MSPVVGFRRGDQRLVMPGEVRGVDRVPARRKSSDPIMAAGEGEIRSLARFLLDLGNFFLTRS